MFACSGVQEQGMNFVSLFTEKSGSGEFNDGGGGIEGIPDRGGI